MSSDNTTVPAFTYNGDMSWWARARFYSPAEAIQKDLPGIEVYDVKWRGSDGIIVVEIAVVGRNDGGDTITEVVDHHVREGDSLMKNPESTGPLDRFMVVEASPSRN